MASRHCAYVRVYTRKSADEKRKASGRASRWPAHSVKLRVSEVAPSTVNRSRKEGGGDGNLEMEVASRRLSG